MNSWEDKYHHIKSEKEELAKQFNDLNDTARLLRTKCAQLESFRKKIINGANFHAAAADAGKITTSIIDAISQPNENQQDYEDLFKCYETLQRDYRAVATKHKSSVQVITKLKKELQSLKRRYGQGPQHYRPKPTGSCAHENSKGQRKSSHVAYSDDVENVLRQLQQRLSDAEKQLLTLSAENEKLQGDGGNDDQLRVSKQSNIEEKNKNEKLWHDLHESNTKLTLVHAQHEFAEAKIKAQGDRLEQLLTLHGEYKSKLGSLKKELQYYREENELLVSKTSQLDECRRQIEEVTRQNDFLESQLTELCEAPFLKSSAEEDHERERDGLKVSIRETQSAYESLVSECNELREQNGILHSRLNFSEGHKAAWGNSVIENTAPPPSESVEKVLNQLDDLQKQHYQTERDLEQSNQLLSAQITINEALQGQIEDSECVMNKKINTLELKSQDLSFKATKRLQRIRLLESKMKVGTTVSQKADGDKGIAHSCLGREDNILEIKVASASLSGERLSDSMVTFVALDFHTFDTQFSNTATGTSPTWNFVASFEMEVDQFLLQTLPNQCVRIEVYTLQSEATPRLFAHASVSMFDLLNENTSTSVSRLELFPIEGETQVGHLSVSLNLAQPLPNPLKSQHVRVGLQSSDTERTEYKCENMWQRQCIKPDVIHIMIDSVTLSIDQRSERERVYFVHYRFMSFGEEITSLVSCDSNGIIHLQHKAEFPILSTIDGRIEPVLLALSKGFIRFALFSSSKRIVENDESRQFMVVGEVQVPLSNAFQSKNEGKIKMDMVSLETKVVASISGTVDSTIKSMPSGINDDFKQLTHFRLMASLCEAFFFLATGSQSSTSKSTQFIKSERLLRFLCPPVGIFDTAQCLQRQISTNFPGKSMRDIFLLPPKQKLSQSEFRRCANNAQSIAMPMPQNDELMDLFQYLSTDEGFVITSDLAFFVESQALETLISTCQALHRRNVFVRQDIREKGTQSSLLTFQSVEEYFESIINGMDEVELSCVLPPSVMQPSEKKTDIN